VTAARSRPSCALAPSARVTWWSSICVPGTTRRSSWPSSRHARSARRSLATGPSVSCVKRRGRSPGDPEPTSCSSPEPAVRVHRWPRCRRNSGNWPSDSTRSGVGDDRPGRAVTGAIGRVVAHPPAPDLRSSGALGGEPCALGDRRDGWRDAHLRRPASVTVRVAAVEARRAVPVDGTLPCPSVSFPSLLFDLRGRGDRATRGTSRQLAGRASSRPLPSLEPRWRRPRPAEEVGTCDRHGAGRLRGGPDVPA
jgi:hypothetical protein